jgi:uncharacterized membrane protein YdjX (TVP38/TMEM64 family)
LKVILLKRVWKWMSLAVLLALAAILFRVDGFTALLKADPEFIRQQSQGSVTLLMLFTLLLMTVQNLFTVIPLFLLVTLNISLFDLFGGYLWSWATSIVGAGIAFFMTRYWFQSFFVRYLNQRFRSSVENSSFWVVLIGRILPLPSSAVNIAAGLSSVGIKPFLYATVLGNMVYILGLSLLSHGMLSLQLQSWTYMAAALIVMISLVLHFWKKRRRNKDDPDEDQAVGI